MPILTGRCGTAGRLAIVLRDPHLPTLTGRSRRLEDEHAATIARRLVRARTRHPDRCTISSSHTEGSAAVLSWSGHKLIGVDLVLIRRVTQRHGDAVLTAQDWKALETTPLQLRAALGWAMKEAAAKATGAAQHYFPDGIRLLPSPHSAAPRAQCIGILSSTFDGDWLSLGGFLCATVVENRSNECDHGANESLLISNDLIYRQ